MSVFTKNNCCLILFPVFLFPGVLFFLVGKTFLKLLACGKFQPLTVVTFSGIFSWSLITTSPDISKI